MRRDLHRDSRHPDCRPHQVPQRAKRAHPAHGAVGEYHRLELWCFTSGQIELDPPAEELAGSDVMRWQRPATPSFSFSRTIARFYSSVEALRLDRRSKRHLQRVQLAALLDWARALR